MAAGMVAEVPREHAAKVKELGMDIEYRPAEDFPGDSSAQAEAQAEAGERGAEEAARVDGGEEGGEGEGKEAGKGEEADGDAEGADEEGEDEAEKPVIVLRTPPYDPRFPSTNQVGPPRAPRRRVSWVSYVECKHM